VKFYRVHNYSPTEGSSGYSFHTTFAEAQKVARAIERGNPDRYEPGSCEIDPIILTPTKTGILAALREVGEHPNNG
jgi:hypothetical protein